jgi:predicted phage tail protein
MEIIGAKEGSFIPGKSPEPNMEISSIAYMKLLIALGEGEIAGGFDGKDIYLDGTPLIGANGLENFANVRWEWRSGVQEQSYIQGFPSVENEVEVNTELKVETPWVKALNNTQLSAVRLRFKFPNGLYYMNDDGGKNGHKVEYALDISTDGGAYEEYGHDGAEGIANTGYEKSYRINLPAAVSGWQIRVRRLTPVKTDGRHADLLQIASMAEIIDAKMTYPHTALLYIEFDAKVFEGRTPTVTVLAKGRIIRVPSNYNPETREYGGVWDGTFKWAWTNNPAWVFYDLVTNPRFGLGNRLTQGQVDKWELYRIAQYCDQPVSDGQGGTEPRFLCDLCISSQADAWTVLMDLSSIFRGMISWSNNTLSVVADMPEDLDPDFIFHRGNVVNGSFNRAGTSERSHYSTGLITYSNPANQYQDDQAPVFVYPLVKRFGLNSLEMTATGCTRETEAQRRGLWAIHTNVDDNGTEFKTGLEGQLPRVGKVIGVANNLFAGREIGGRISSAAGRSVTVDRDIVAKVGDRLIVNLPTGKAEGRTVSGVTGRVITVTAAYSVQPEADFGWALDADDLAIQQYRVKRVANEGNNQFTISAIPYNPNKYARIDDGAVLDDRPVSIIPPHGQDMPSDIAITSSYSVNQGIGVTTMFVSWSPAAGAVAYEAQWRQNNGNWINVPRSGSCNFEVVGIYAGRYQVRVRAVSPSDVFSVWVNSEEVTLTGKPGKPPAIVALKATSDVVFGINLSWGFGKGSADGLKTTLMVSSLPDLSDEMLLSDIPYPQHVFTITGMAAGTRRYFRASFTDKLGNQSDWSEIVDGTSSNSAADILSYLSGQIGETELGKDLLERINGAATAENVELLAELVAEAQAQIDANREELKADAAALQQAINAVKVLVDTINADLSRSVEGLHQDLEQLAKASIENSLTIVKTRDDLSAAAAALDTDIQGVKGQVVADRKELQTAVDAANKNVDKTKETLEKADADLQEKIDKMLGDTTGSFAAVQEQIVTLTEADKAQAENISTVTAKVDGNTAAINAESLARTDGDTALGQRIDVVKTDVAGNAASITTLQQSQSDLNGAVASVAQNLEAVAKTGIENALNIDGTKQQQAAINASITSEQKVMADQQQAQATQITGLQANYGNVSARLTTEETTRATADSALSQRVDSLSASTGQNQANVNQQLQALADKDSAQATQISDISAQTANNTASITAEAKARTDADKAIAETVTALDSKVGSNQASVTQSLKTLADKDNALAQSIDGIDAKVGAANSAIQSEALTRASADSALSQRIDVVKAETEGNAASIIKLEEAQSDANSSSASIKQSLEALAKADVEQALKQAGDVDRQAAISAKLTTRQDVMVDEQQAQAKQLTQLDAQFGKTAAQLQQEISTRASADEAAATRLDALNATVVGNQAQANQQLQALADKDSAQAQLITGLQAETGKNTALIASEVQSRTDADSALGQRIDATNAEVGKNTVAVVAETKARADADSALGQRVESIKADTAANSASITAEAKSRTDADTALSQRVDSVKAQTEGNAASIIKLEEAQTGADSSSASIKQSLEAAARATIEQALKQNSDVEQQVVVSAKLNTAQTVTADQQQAQAQRLSTMEVSYGATVARLTKEETTRATADSALSQQITDLSARTGENAANLTVLSKTVTDNKSATAQQIAGLEAKVGDNAANIISESTARSTADSALGQRIDAVKSTTDKNTADVTALTKTVTDNGTATAQQITNVSTAVNGVKTDLQTETTARSTADTALGKRIDTVSAVAGENSAAVQQVSQAQATLNGKISASWTVKVQVDNQGNKVVGGIGLGVDGDGNSQFLVDANRFAVISTANGVVSSPFIVQGNQTFISSGFIQDASITNAKISGWLGSDNYVSGWRGWAIDKSNGGFEMNGSGGGGRTVINNGGVKVYDENNVLVVELGIFS